MFKTADEFPIRGGYIREEVYKNNKSGEERLLTIENKSGHLGYSWSCCGSSSENPAHNCFHREGYISIFLCYLIKS